MMFEFLSPGLPQIDIGAFGVMIPMVATAEEARTIIACTRYPPAGRRGAAFGFAHDDFHGGDLVAKISALHERTMVIVQALRAASARSGKGSR